MARMAAADTDENEADFGNLPWTPGESNNREEPPEFSSDFEEFDAEEDIVPMPGSFVPARVIDPGLASTTNPNPIPESPDGGCA